VNFWIRDPKTKERSATLTLLIYGYFVCVAKLLVSGVIVGTVNLGAFSGIDFAAAIGALGALYGVRKYTDVSKRREEP
jgi:membrane associated rhomboid family serine protease